jgi:DNA-binding CsgD family transcriptional regulator
VTEVSPGLPWFYPLTPREAEVLELLAQGLTNDEISKRLYLNRTLIDKVVYTSKEKLYLSTREELAEWVAKSRPPGSPSARTFFYRG